MKKFLLYNKFNLSILWALIFATLGIVLFLYLFTGSIHVNAKITGVSSSYCMIPADIKGGKPAYGASYYVKYTIGNKTYTEETNCMEEIKNYKDETIELYVAKFAPERFISTNNISIMLFLVILFTPIFWAMGLGSNKEDIC